MNRPQLYEIRVFWFPAGAFPLGGDKHNVDSINRYARDDSHAVSIGKNFARETLKAGEVFNVEAKPINLA